MKLTFYKAELPTDSYHFKLEEVENPGVYYLHAGRVLNADTHEILVPIVIPPLDCWEAIESLTGYSKEAFRMAGYYFNEGYKLGWEDRAENSWKRFPK